MTHKRAHAELVLLSGDVRTMSTEVSAQAVAVANGRIAFVGDNRGAREYIGPKTRVVELAGATVVPGMVDAHCHLYGLGASLEAVDLRGAESAEAAAARVAGFAVELGPDEWVTGRGWDQNLWSDEKFPEAAVLDAVSGKHPVALRRIDGHALWANSAAMARAGINANTPDPQGGKIVRDAKGAPTGVFIDNAIELVEAEIPRPGGAVIERRILKAANLAASLGLTGVHEMSIGPDVVEAYRRLDEQNRLPIRVVAYLAANGSGVEVMASRSPDADAGRRFRVRGLKLFIDGALGSRGAALLEDYADDAGNRGLWLLSPETVHEAALAAAASGWQLAIHAIGDAGNRAVLDAYAAARKAYPEEDLRFRVEHAQILHEADVTRFAELGVIASMQPTHATSDMLWAPQRLGATRMKGAYAIKTIMGSGAHVAFGSDFPIEKVSPLLGVYAAVLRQDASGLPAEGFAPAERISLDEALRAFTLGAAYAVFAEDRLGTIETGKIADLTVYARELSPGPALLETAARMVIVDGQVVFEQP